MCNCTFGLLAVFQSSMISQQFSNFQLGLTQHCVSLYGNYGTVGAFDLPIKGTDSTIISIQGNTVLCKS